MSSAPMAARRRRCSAPRRTISCCSTASLARASSVTGWPAVVSTSPAPTLYLIGIDAPAELLPPRGGEREVGHDRRLVEGGHQPPQRALAHRTVDPGAGGLRLFHQVGEGQDGVARQHPFLVASAEGDRRARLAPDHAGVGYPAREHFGQEVGHRLLQRLPLRGVGEVGGLVGAQAAPGWRPPARRSSGPCAWARSSSAKNARAAVSAES